MKWIFLTFTFVNLYAIIQWDILELKLSSENIKPDEEKFN